MRDKKKDGKIPIDVGSYVLIRTFKDMASEYPVSGSDIVMPGTFISSMRSLCGSLGIVESRTRSSKYCTLVSGIDFVFSKEMCIVLKKRRVLL
jgi:hypothetical protein